ncbi:hypothetical protein V2G26_000831 [Clonostachys chloroleuca]
MADKRPDLEGEVDVLLRCSGARLSDGQVIPFPDMNNHLLSISKIRVPFVRLVMIFSNTGDHQPPMKPPIRDASAERSVTACT